MSVVLIKNDDDDDDNIRIWFTLDYCVLVPVTCALQWGHGICKSPVCLATISDRWSMNGVYRRLTEQWIIMTNNNIIKNDGEYCCGWCNLVIFFECMKQYTLWTIKRWQYICNHNSGKSWWLLITLKKLETGINTVCKWVAYFFIHGVNMTSLSCKLK